MKKLLLFVIAALVSATSFADIVITGENVQSSYNNEEKTFTLSEIDFGYLGAQYSNGSPKFDSKESAKKAFIQLRKFQDGGNPAGQIYNKTAISLKSVTVLQQNEKNFKFSAGDAANALSEIENPDPEVVNVTIKMKDDSDLEIEVKKFVFNLDGKKFFKIENVDNNIIYLHSISIDDSATALENTVVENNAVKRIVNGQVIIERDGVRYNVIGQVIK